MYINLSSILGKSISISFFSFNEKTNSFGSSIVLDLMNLNLSLFDKEKI